MPDVYRGAVEKLMYVGWRPDGDMLGQFLDSLDAVGDGNWWLRVRVPSELDRYLVFKGSIALDGISLTIAAVENGLVSVTIIPHTYANTTLGSRRKGDRLNVECDMLAKHVEKLLAGLVPGNG